MWLENGGNPVRVQGSPDGGTEGLTSLEMGNKEAQVRLVGQDNSSERWIVHRGHKTIRTVQRLYLAKIVLRTRVDIMGLY